MKKKITYIFLIVIPLFMLTGCFNKEEDNTFSNVQNNSLNEVISSVKVLINGKEYMLSLENNETSQAFVAILPQEFNMEELNGNEKYVYLDKTFPSNSSNPGHIEKGDVMLYGSDCLVIFYKSFDTSYSYTKIGHIDNLPDLGKDNISVQFKK